MPIKGVTVINKRYLVTAVRPGCFSPESCTLGKPGASSRRLSGPVVT